MSRSALWRLAKVLVFAATLAPGIWLLWAVFNDGLGADPVDAIRDHTGDWTLRLLLITLAISPLRQLTGWSGAIRFRRMLGLFAFFYAFVHFFTYLWLDQIFDWGAIVQDVIKRPWITAGVTAFVLMVPLAITSTKKWIGRLGGKRWQVLHRLIYFSAIGGVLHYYWLVKLDTTRPVRYGAVLAVLLGYRLWVKFQRKEQLKKIAVVLLLGSVAMTSAAQNPVQARDDNPFTIKVGVDLVLFNVTVQDNKGNLVSGLQAKNFKLYEDGQEQEINFFQPEDIPATVGLVIDNSGSMIPKRAEVIEAGLTFARARNPQDEVFIVNFNDRVSLGLPPSVPFTSDYNELSRSLRRISATGRTALYDGIVAALDHLEKGRHQRKALVVLSDGGDNASRYSLDGALLEMQRSGATVFTIGIYAPDDQYKNPRVLRTIAKQGGGEAYFPRGAFELSQVWEKIAGGIRSQYTLGFTPKNHSTKGGYRKVLVRATGKDGKALRVRTRDGYRAGDSQ